MSKRKRILTAAEIQKLLDASDNSDSSLSSEEDGWPTTFVDSENEASFMLNDDSDTDGMEEDEEEAPIDDASTQDVSQDDGMEEDEEEAPIDDASSQDVSQDNSKIHWTKKVKNEDIKFKHEKIGGGPVHDLPVGSSPFDFFKQFFTLDMCQTILMNTNKYDSYVQNKQSSHSSNWKPIEVLDEIWSFIAIVFVMGITKLPRLKDYWSSNPILGNKLVKKTMPRDRFLQILRRFHLSDRETEKNPNDENYEFLQKLNPYMVNLKKNCKNNFNPNKNMSIDEAMIKYKGRLGIVQYMPKKPAKRGIKVWMLCDSFTGYVYTFEVYCGKRDNIPRTGDNGLGHDVVKHLCASLRERGHHLYFDRFFTSVPLMKDLLDLGQYACGTVQTNRKFLPQGIAKTKFKKAGESECFQCVETPNLLCSVWRDKKSIFFLSTSSKNVISTVNRRIKGIQTPLPCPLAVKEYNNHMGGVDLADQMRQYYQISRRSYKWWLYVFWFMLDTAVNNAYVLYTYTNRPSVKRKKTLLDFKMDCILEMTTISNDNFLVKSPSMPSPSIHKRVKGRKRVCRRCTTLNKKTAGNNSIQSTWMCEACQVSLCIDCFPAYHA